MCRVDREVRAAFFMPRTSEMCMDADSSSMMRNERCVRGMKKAVRLSKGGEHKHMESRIKKVKVTKANKVEIEYERSAKSGGWDQYSLSCSDEAKPSFYACFETLKSHVMAMCELPESYVDKITVRGVTFSYGGEAEIMGATLVASMELEESNCPLNLVTPHKASGSYSESPADPKALLDYDCIEVLETLQAECEAYINGDRAQGRLFDSSAA